MKVNKIGITDLKTYKKQTTLDKNVARFLKAKLDMNIKSDVYVGKTQK